jgi:hypothetical protein
MSLTTATAMIVTTRLLVGTEIIHIDQNRLHALHARLAGESRLRQIEAELVTRSLSFPPEDRTGVNIVHSWIEPATSNGVVVEYLGCERLADVPLSVCNSLDTQGLAVHTYRVSIRMDFRGGVIRLQSLYHTHYEYNSVSTMADVNLSQPAAMLTGSVAADERDLLPAGRASWISY